MVKKNKIKKGQIDPITLIKIAAVIIFGYLIIKALSLI